MKHIRCVASALAASDWAIAVMDGCPVVVDIGDESPSRLRVFALIEGESVYNPCDGVVWRVENGQWNAALSSADVACREFVTTGPVMTADPWDEPALARQFGVESVLLPAPSA